MKIWKLLREWQDGKRGSREPRSLATRYQDNGVYVAARATKPKATQSPLKQLTYVKKWFGKGRTARCFNFKLRRYK